MNKKRFIEIIISAVLAISLILINVFGFKAHLNLFFVIVFFVASILIVFSHDYLFEGKGVTKYVLEFLSGFDIIFMSEVHLTITPTPILAIIVIGAAIFLITTFSLSFTYFITELEENKKGME